MQLRPARRTTVVATAAATLTGWFGVALATAPPPSSPTRTTTSISGPSQARAGQTITVTAALKDARGRAVPRVVVRLVGRDGSSSRERNLYFGKTGNDGRVSFRFVPPAGRAQYKAVYNGSASPQRDGSQSRTLTVTVSRASSPSPSASPTAGPSGTPDPSETPDPGATGTPEPTETPDPSGTPDPGETPDPSATPEPTESGEPTASASPSPTGGGSTTTCPVAGIPSQLQPLLCRTASASPTTGTATATASAR